MPRLEVWLVSAQSCPRCSKISLPRPVKQNLHQVCKFNAVAATQANRTRSRNLRKLGRAQTGSLICPSENRPGLVSINLGLSNTKIQKRKMDRSAVESDTDSDSVIILTDEDDDKPIRQRLEEFREVPAREVIKKEAEVVTPMKSDLKLSRGGVTNVEGVSNLTFEDHMKREDNTTTLTSEVKVDSFHTSSSSFKIKKVEVVTKEEDGEKTDSDDDEQFEKHSKQDMNFVVAKFMVKKKVGFVCDTNSNLTPFEKMMRNLLDRADILQLKKSLDDGGETFTPKELKIKKFKPVPLPPAQLPLVPVASVLPLSDDESPNTTQTLPIEHASAPQMPVVASDVINSSINKENSEKLFKFKPYCSISKNKIIKLRNPILRPPTPLKPEVLFPSIKTKSFKIPRSSKIKIPRWVTNGSHWKWALTVDDAGQYSRTEKERKRVPWASVVTKRRCEEFQCWLIRRTFKEGDDCDWSEKKEVEKKVNDEVKRRREEMMWREKVLDKMLGGDVNFGDLASTRDPLGLDERDSGTGSLEIGHSSTSSTLAGLNATEELTENDLNVSGQSLVTHIQTPTHTFVMDEVDSEGTDCMDEPVGETVDAHKKISSCTQPSGRGSEPPFSSLVGLRGHPPTPPPSINVFNTEKLQQSIKSPTPSVATSVGFAFTRVSQPPTSTSTAVVKRKTEDEVANNIREDYSTQAQGFSVFSGLVATKKSRFKLF